ncbi:MULTISPECIES: KpsF/GutQ family sugar-phosphate isomerase [Stenotrophomonas]|uniref:KpsF/GutQ family sugar-phosphate isomerase n=1 Tax=Stenotrophomonas TaxID=40323 RepID=UPI000D3B6E84|nr:MULTISPECIES: KpsF/GutQ family sugar-phosphate isomerase [Stenotrophomonas]PTS72524.1 KpsF/GutQ family sugar-phosphate isomerase [Stenotrophomonas sp. HMWF023]CAH0196438.1 Arabinose 5-phosphate isomerase KdsD [Stenotrophomonas lactitubi]CAH0221803.1 Arabinose 5-phosphate isomerase KdsD [Stenotrophomonas lactitubi]CAH0236616.1 Arabinose 5-phosphate isomerase KdsD [Stenotrophomonas lactitubi]CAH0266253.1 Arabinose 5-phosphate isomerase KdsD [Stenotrophomonas lactitubi]
MSSVVSVTDHIASAKRVLQIEASAVAALAGRLDAQFTQAVEQILSSQGRVIVCGMGKSGIIGRKIVATLASTGTPSFFMHPGEAFHGDLGMVTATDVFVAISYSGETEEVVKLLPFLKDNGNFLVAITGRPTSTLAQAADCHLDAGVAQEACPLALAPTASTTATLAMGDALAVALMEARGFQPENFARFHPGGSLGRRLLSRVEHEMVAGELPLVDASSPMMDVLQVITRSSLGLAIVQTGSGHAIITDGDIRRALELHGREVFDKSAAELMTASPAHVSVGTRVEDALVLMERRRISSLLVLDGNKLVGVFKK